MRAESILIVDDEPLIRWSLKQELAKESYPTLEATTLAEALQQAADRDPDLILLDQRLPDGTGIEVLRQLREINCASPVILLTAYDRSDIAVQAMKLGAYDYLTKPVNNDELKLLIQKALEESKVRRQLARFVLAEDQNVGSKIVGVSPAIKTVHDFIKKVSQSNTTTVLITGESGTGKELIARAIHCLGVRKNMPFMAINCSAIPEHLIESELFGHEKGAFTDARSQHKGIFELSNGGTVFLDEIGDMIPSLQVALLRVIEEKTFRRVGGSIDISVDVRIIAATNQQLEQRLAAGMFREDLFYRLNVASIEVPPLRQRGEDVILLAEHFLQQHNVTFNKRFRGLSEPTRQLFLHYSWPGNVRELKNVLERAILLYDEEYVQPRHVQLGSLNGGSRKDVSPSSDFHHGHGHLPEAPATESISLFELEREAIINALSRSNSNQSKAARLLKVSRDKLRYRMKKHGLS